MAAFDLQLHLELDEILAALQEAGWVRPVRCRECAVPHNRWTGCPVLDGKVTHPDFYCSAGLRKEDEQPEPPEGGDGDGTTNL